VVGCQSWDKRSRLIGSVRPIDNVDDTQSLKILPNPGQTTDNWPRDCYFEDRTPGIWYNNEGQGDY
jgi:hypothetical protein